MRCLSCVVTCRTIASENVFQVHLTWEVRRRNRYDRNKQRSLFEEYRNVLTEILHNIDPVMALRS